MAGERAGIGPRDSKDKQLRVLAGRAAWAWSTPATSQPWPPRSPPPPPGMQAKTYWLTGPGLISNYDVAAALSKLLGRTIIYRELTFEENKDAMTRAGVPEQIAEMNAQAFSLAADGDAESSSTPCSSAPRWSPRPCTRSARPTGRCPASWTATCPAEPRRRQTGRPGPGGPGPRPRRDDVNRAAEARPETGLCRTHRSTQPALTLTGGPFSISIFLSIRRARVYAATFPRRADVATHRNRPRTRRGPSSAPAGGGPPDWPPRPSLGGWRHPRHHRPGGIHRSRLLRQVRVHGLRRAYRAHSRRSHGHLVGRSSFNSRTGTSPRGR